LTEIKSIHNPTVAVGAASAVGVGSDLGMNVRAGGPWLVVQVPPGDDKAGCAWIFEWRTVVRAHSFLCNTYTDLFARQGCLLSEEVAPDSSA
jgi:hypothetical protein